MNSMIAQVKSLPDLIRGNLSKLDDEVINSLDHDFCISLKRLYITGCGDSHHASLATELAFEALSGVPTEPMTALQFAHYAVGYLPDTGPETNAVVGISVSGEVSRTLEALNLARLAGAATVSLTATPRSRIAEAGEKKVFSTIPPFPDPQGTYTPGIRTYAATQIVLFLMAIRIGEVRGNLTSHKADQHRRELLTIADAAEQTILMSENASRELVEALSDAQEFVFAGGGPNYGTALFSAAKVMEASGDSAIGQDLEEWAHLQYFTKDIGTPTFFIITGKRDISRGIELVAAARAIGRRVIAVSPGSYKSFLSGANYALPLAEGVSEIYSPLIAAIPTELFAAFRSDFIAEPYFRAFGGGRSIEGGGGASCIRTSVILEEIPSL